MDFWDVGVTANGSVLAAPAGPLKLALGLYRRSEQFSLVNDTTSFGQTSSLGTPSQRRHVVSAFSELGVPLIGEENAQSSAARLDLSIAARYDHYDDFGGTTNPKFGIRWRPMQDITFRASYGRSYRAPSLG